MALQIHRKNKSIQSNAINKAAGAERQWKEAEYKRGRRTERKSKNCRMNIKKKTTLTRTNDNRFDSVTPHSIQFIYNGNSFERHTQKKREINTEQKPLDAIKIVILPAQKSTLNSHKLQLFIQFFSTAHSMM